VKPNLYDSKLNVHFHGFLRTEVISAYTDGFSQLDLDWVQNSEYSMH
jgi:hypothetical protein